jgi:hypothetical protein
MIGTQAFPARSVPSVLRGEIPEALQAMRAEAKRNKTAKLTSRQIDREITTYRRQRNKRNKK